MKTWQERRDVAAAKRTKYETNNGKDCEFPIFNKCQANYERYEAFLEGFNAGRADLIEDVKKLIQALEFYADENEMIDCCHDDFGKTIGYMPSIDDFELIGSKKLKHFGKKARMSLKSFKEKHGVL